MNIHFIVAPSTHLRPLMKELSSKHHITTLPEEMTSNTDCVVVDPPRFATSTTIGAETPIAC